MASPALPRQAKPLSLFGFSLPLPILPSRISGAFEQPQQQTNQHPVSAFEGLPQIQAAAQLQLPSLPHVAASSSQALKAKMDHRPQAWGRPRDDVYGAYDHSYMQDNGPKQNTQQPIVTGTSVIGIKFKDGVVMAADNLASYGSLARFTDVKRLRTFADSSIVGFSGDISDMQYLDRHLIDLSLSEAYESPDKPRLNAANLHRYLSKLLYNRRSKFDPLWNHLLIGGLDDNGEPFLAAADLLGSTYSAPSLATGFGAMLAQPIMRRYVPDEESAKKLSREEAINIVKEAMKVLFYRDARSLDSYSLAVVTKEGVELKQDEKLEDQSWAFADRIKGYGTQTV